MIDDLLLYINNLKETKTMEYRMPTEPYQKQNDYIILQNDITKKVELVFTNPKINAPKIADKMLEKSAKIIESSILYSYPIDKNKSIANPFDCDSDN